MGSDDFKYFVSAAFSAILFVLILPISKA
jgi:hypothetical protein